MDEQLPEEEPTKTKTKTKTLGRVSRLTNKVNVLSVAVLALAACLLATSILHGVALRKYAQANTEMHERLISDLQSKSFPLISPAMMEYSVRIRVSDGMNGGGSGSGVLVSSKYVVTNYHVVQKAISTKTVWIDIPNNEDSVFTSHVGTVEFVDSARDLALIKLPNGLDAKKWAKLSKVQLKCGDQIIAVSCPDSTLPIVTSGFYGRRAYDSRAELSINAFWGSSGGPVYSAASGEVVCIFANMEAPAVISGTTYYPTFLFYGVPATWIIEMMKTHGIEN